MKIIFLLILFLQCKSFFLSEKAYDFFEEAVSKSEFELNKREDLINIWNTINTFQPLIKVRIENLFKQYKSECEQKEKYKSEKENRKVVTLSIVKGENTQFWFDDVNYKLFISIAENFFYAIKKDKEDKSEKEGKIDEKALTKYELVGGRFEINKKSFFLISSAISSADEILVHELLHMKHYLDTKCGRSVKKYCGITSAKDTISFLANLDYIEATDLGKGALYKYKDLFPELKCWKRYALWVTFEERRTVCGPDIDFLTENSYRLKKKASARYIYQGSDVIFLEDADIVEDVFDKKFFFNQEVKDFEYKDIDKCYCTEETKNMLEA